MSFIRDKIREELTHNAQKVVDCIFEKKCKWYDEKDKSAEQIADCMIEHLDLSEYTSDEFEWALEVIHLLCGIQYLQEKTEKNA